MGETSIGDGMAALAYSISFWGFVSVCVWAGMWNGVRKREAEQATLRAMLAAGKEIDEGELGGMLNGARERKGELRAYGIVAIFAGAGLALAAWPLSPLAAWVFAAMMGAATLTGFTGAGLLAASGFARG